MHDLGTGSFSIVAAVAARIAIGAAWYSPMAFLNPWLKLQKMTAQDMKAGMVRSIVVDVIGAIVMALVLVHAVHYAHAGTLAEGAAVGFFGWLGFIAVATLSIDIYAKRPLQLFAINNGFQLLSLLVMGAILAVWS
jgi:hypothetical protein